MTNQKQKCMCHTSGNDYEVCPIHEQGTSNNEPTREQINSVLQSEKEKAYADWKGSNIREQAYTHKMWHIINKIDECGSYSSEHPHGTHISHDNGVCETTCSITSWKKLVIKEVRE